MDTITHRIGSVRALTITPEDEAGAPVPASDVEMRVSAGDVCVILQGVSDGVDSFVVTLTDVELAPRVYRASIYVDGRHEGDVALNIEGGC